MKKRILLLSALLVTALLLTGCAMRTVEEMYALPKRSEAYSQLQSAIDAAMTGLNYSAPISGMNQQSVQTADLDGDGIDEYLVFAAGNWERPLQVLILAQDGAGGYRLIDIVDGNGTAFEQVEYAQFDDKPGSELIIGCQVSDQVLRSVSVYSLAEGSMHQLLTVGYSKFLTGDLDGSGQEELVVLRSGETDGDGGVAVTYGFQNGQIIRSTEARLSCRPGQIRRLRTGALENGQEAVFVSSASEDGAITIDVIAHTGGRLSNILPSRQTDTAPLRNFYAYPEDIDDDGVIEVPERLPMRTVSSGQSEDRVLLRWFSQEGSGAQVNKLYTFHYFLGGWYVKLNGTWADRVSVVQGEGVYTFYVWSEDYRAAESLLSIYILTGNGREENAVSDGRFPLHRTETQTYAARLEQDAASYGITEEYLMECFRMIRQDRRMD